MLKQLCSLGIKFGLTTGFASEIVDIILEGMGRDQRHSGRCHRR